MTTMGSKIPCRGSPDSRMSPIWYLVFENDWLLSDLESVQTPEHSMSLLPGPVGSHGKMT